MIARRARLEAALGPARRMCSASERRSWPCPLLASDDPPRGEIDGEGLASVLAYMAFNDPQGFEDLVAVTRKPDPPTAPIRFRRRPVKRSRMSWSDSASDTNRSSRNRAYQGEVILFDFDHAENVPPAPSVRGR